MSEIEKFLDYAAENGLIEESMFRRQQKKVIIPTHMKNPWPEGLKKLMGISKGGPGSGRKTGGNRDAVTGKPIVSVKVGAPKFPNPRRSHKPFRTTYGWAGGGNRMEKGGQGSGRTPDPAGQKCPKCGKEFHDNKWGGAGKCDCGHYFRPEWYGKPKNV